MHSCQLFDYFRGARKVMEQNPFAHNDDQSHHNNKLVIEHSLSKCTSFTHICRGYCYWQSVELMSYSFSKVNKF